MEVLKELKKLCEALNAANIKYVIVGGCAVILHGYYRTTHDIDFLIDPSMENVKKLKESLAKVFSTKEVFEISDDDVMKYTVVRFAPEAEDIVIDLVGRIGDISFEVAIKDVEEIDLEGVKIPVCGLSTLIETKKGVRPKDKEDLLFLMGKKEYLNRQQQD
ncbi:MAG: nucleotidyltransferase [Nitrospirae bacterium]|nr:nucleotidyltransferase [Nitrospirota bacterium]